MTEGLLRLASALAAPFVASDSRTYWPTLVVALVVAWVATGSLKGALAPALWRTRSAWLDVQLLVGRQLLALVLPAAWLSATFAAGVWVARSLDRAFGIPDPSTVPPIVLTVCYTAALFVAWDASRYLVHRLMHEVPLLWEFHQVHHSATVLTPLTFHRVHPVEGLLYGLRGMVVSGSLAGLFFWGFRGQAAEWTVLGVNGVGLFLNAATGNLRHSHVWLRFPAPVERWLLSPAQHQLHHAADAGMYGSNFGTWLAVWDRLAGSLHLADQPPMAFGLGAAARNHDDDLVSAWLGPLRGAARRLFAFGFAVVVCLGFAQPGHAADEEVEPDETLDVGYEMEVFAPKGLPRVGGSAHEISEAELVRWGYNDVTRVIGKVPGVYVRTEDGFGLRPNIGMRGGNSDRSAKITLLQDGIPLSPAPYAAPAAYYFPVAARLVGIQVFKGAASIRHGPQTIGGAVNVLTRPVPEAAEAAMDASVGLYSTMKLHGHAGAGNERFGLLIEGVHLESDGFKALDTGGPTGFERQDGMVKLSGKIGTPTGPHAGIGLHLGVGREASDETYLGLSSSDFAITPYRRYAASANDRMQWRHTEERLAVSFGMGRSLEVVTTGYHHWLGRSWTKLNRFSGGPDLHDLLAIDAGGQSAVFLAILQGQENSVTPEQALMVGTNDRTFHNGGVQSVATLRKAGERFGSELEVGARVHADDVVRRHTEDPYGMQEGVLVPLDGDTLTTLDAHTTATGFAAWAAEDARLGKVHVLPGARLEAVRTAAGTTGTGPQDPAWQAVVLPGLGLFASPTDWLDLLGGVHRGFAPVPPGADPQETPEIAWSTEAGARVDTGATRAEVIGFYSSYDNLTGQCTLSGGCLDAQLDQQFNGGEAMVAGLEVLLAHGILLPHRVMLGLSGSYTLTTSRFRTGFVSAFPQWGTVAVGDALPYVPAHQGTASIGLDHPFAGASLSATGRGAMRDEAGQGPIDGPARLPGLVQFDGTGHVWASERVRLYLNAQNLTNVVVAESLRPFGARPNAPFLASFGVHVGAPRVR